MTVHEFLNRMNGVRKSGRGWVAQCVAHEDRHQSLSISEGEDGRLLLHCHAGCPTEKIVGALGLTLADLYPDGSHSNGHAEPMKRIITTYDYTGEHGTLLYQAVRYDPKDFRQRRPDGKD